jgi:hypothetical protein
MAIVDDYAGIAAELRRIRAEKSPEKPAEARREPASQHPPADHDPRRVAVSQAYCKKSLD